MAIDPYLDPASGVLRNKLGITDPTKLSNFERDASALRQASMIANPVGGKLDFDHFKAVHERLFQDVYDWAGQTRTVEISKGNSAFAPVQHIETHAKKVFGDLAAENHLQGMKRDQFLDRAAHHLGEINALHPFREGNGRAQRAFMDEVAGRAGYGFDWSKTNQKEMIAASYESFHSSPKKLRDLLDRTLVEPLKEKQREDRLDALAKDDPAAHKTIVGVRDNVLQLSESNVGSAASRERLANAVTDRLLDHHAQGKDVTKLVQPVAPKVAKDSGLPGLGR